MDIGTNCFLPTYINEYIDPVFIINDMPVFSFFHPDLKGRNKKILSGYPIEMLHLNH